MATDVPASTCHSLDHEIQETVTSSRRARELYKYFVPPGSDIYATQSTFPDTVLTAHAQLVAWRLNCQRAMVSLIDRDTQYFVAESTKTLHLDDASQYGDPGDALWAGCINVPKAGRLCEHTIQTMPTPTSPAYFEVLDLTKDERFNTLPFVTAEPFFKYYCGVPLRTKNGIAIGSLFALDDKVKAPISETNKAFMATMAENVMSHYSNMKEKEDRRRVLNMNMCLAAFVDPEHMANKRKRKREGASASSLRTRSEKSSSAASLNPLSPKSRRDSSRGSSGRRNQLSGSRSSPPSKPHSDSISDDSDDDTVPPPRVEEDDHIETFRRAADLLHSSLSLNDGGGVVFLDTDTSYRGKHKASEISSEGDSELDSNYSLPDSTSNRTMQSTTSWGASSSRREPPDQLPQPVNPCEVLATTTTVKTREYTAPSQEDISHLIKQHPRGNLFNLGPDSAEYISSSDEHTAYNLPKSKRTNATKREILLLSRYFPGAKQIIFIPLWDSTTSRFSAFFAYSTTEFRTLSHNPCLLFCIAFCNCVMTEISRLATLAADQQKSDFIGSISHELRSPLHGILASCEFLGDTETTSFQKSLVDTADSCARTLLDTINMVLDYSKINAFERNANKARRQGRTLQSSLQESSGQPQLNIYGNVDLASITEEVVEGVATGQIFKDSLNSLNDLGTSEIAGNAGKAYSGQGLVDIIIDIAPRAEWKFVTQPGAFRRIIMNIFGNALKYTREGYIKVKLESTKQASHTHEGGEDAQVTIIRLTISDTGIGMSPHFMRTKLYTPFAQENSIAPGTGLGLSLVKSMVTMLNGEISINSTLGQGTTVIVQFPMSPSTPNSSSTVTSGSTPSSAGSIERVQDNSLSIVQQKLRGRRAFIYPDPNTSLRKPSSDLFREATTVYLDGWFGFDVQNQWHTNFTNRDIVVVHEAYLSALIKALPDSPDSFHTPMIVVLCAASSRRSKVKIPRTPNIEAISYPFGPYKLAKCIRTCVERIEQSTLVESDAETEAGASSKKVDPKEAAVENVINAIEKVKITHSDPDVPDIIVLKSGDVLANEDSINAGLMIGSPGTAISSGSSQDKAEYPFPINDGTISPSNLDVSENERPSLASRRTISPTMNEIALKYQPIEATSVSGEGAKANTPPLYPVSSRRIPRLLLVDDNKVNLRLLQTFMKKRKYEDIYSAEDGQQAVSVFQELLSATPPHPPDIIFLDISMPVMNGFEAARRIRAIELEFREYSVNPMETPPSSLIIALTGLASGRDQSEAFTSGFDLYLVKPISFREVGRLLDNWEKNDLAVGVPHGAAVAGGSERAGIIGVA